MHNISKLQEKAILKLKYLEKNKHEADEKFIYI